MLTATFNEQEPGDDAECGEQVRHGVAADIRVTRSGAAVPRAGSHAAFNGTSRGVFLGTSRGVFLADALDEVRRSEYRRLAGKDRAFIKGQRYTLVSSRENLSHDGRASLRKLLNANKRLNVAYLLKESFGQLRSYQSRSQELSSKAGAGEIAGGSQKRSSSGCRTDALGPGIPEGFRPGDPDGHFGSNRRRVPEPRGAESARRVHREALCA